MLLWLISCTEFQSEVMTWIPIEIETPQIANADELKFTTEVYIEGFAQVTDIQFNQELPLTSEPQLLVAQKEGALWWIKGDERKLLHQFSVKTTSEQGLLAVALHPKFNENSRLFVHLNPKSGKARTSLQEYKVDLVKGNLQFIRTIFEEPQPYPNHNGGALQFGVDGMLYMGLGDGGWRNDPKGNGQDTSSPLGSILRFDIDSDNIIPADNPFVDVQTVEFTKGDGKHDLLWASGLRNPWKFITLPDGRLIIADVGQNAWEEISIATKGDNLGWNFWEGNVCIQEECPVKDVFGSPFVKPIHTYSHDVGQSITGGVIYKGNRSSKGHYVFADFASGNLWSLSQWDSVDVQVHEWGSLGFNPSTFASDHRGNTYVADFVSGTVYKLTLP